MTDLTSAIARFTSAPPFDAVPEAARSIIRSGFIDTSATMIAGQAQPVVQILRRHLGPRVGASGEAAVVFGAVRGSAIDAALLNGTAAHALDYDDVALGGHPSTVLVPAVLAEGEACGASGSALMRAYLVGYEVWADLISRDADPHHEKGWHPTAVFGTVAAAAAVACLRRLPFQVARNAIALSASMAGGVVANFGTMTKPLHAGRAAAAGVEAVRLAMLRMTAAADAIEHPAGFLTALSPKGRLDLERPARLGATLRILDAGLSIKKYPTCYATHRVIDGMLDAVRGRDVTPGQVEHVHAEIGRTQAKMLRNHTPQTGLEAKFSLEFAVASALIAGEVGLSQLTDGFVQRADVQAVMRRVSTSVRDTACPIEPAFGYADRVHIRLADGQELDSGAIRFARGNAQLPLAEAELKAKFMDCLRAAGSGGGERLYDQLAGLDSLREARALTLHA